MALSIHNLLAKIHVLHVYHGYLNLWCILANLPLSAGYNIETSDGLLIKMDIY